MRNKTTEQSSYSNTESKCLHFPLEINNQQCLLVDDCILGNRTKYLNTENITHFTF